MTGNLELVGQRYARVWHAMPDRLIELDRAALASSCFQFENPFLKFRARRDIRRDRPPYRLPPMSFVLRVFSGAERFEPSR